MMKSRSPRPTGRDSSNRQIAVAIILMMGLVFGPVTVAHVVGLHIASAQAALVQSAHAPLPELTTTR